MIKYMALSFGGKKKLKGKCAVVCVALGFLFLSGFFQVQCGMLKWLFTEKFL